MSSARKAAEMSGQMLTYLGQTRGQREPQNLAELCRSQLSQMHTACLELADTGSGIAAGDIEKVFDPFYSALSGATENSPTPATTRNPWAAPALRGPE